MTEARPYQRPKSVKEAAAELKRCAGTQFDRAVVEAFCGVLEEAESRPDLAFVRA
jgi:HD-GYP domain-containing protein (c-di-GMP phosphodiesterase class II)